MNKILLVSLSVLIILLVCFVFFSYKFTPSYDENKLLNVSKIKNKDRHKDKNSSYAHFSQITSRTPSIFEYPLYYLSHPVEYTLTAGQFLYIPKNWWHWVVSFTEEDPSYCFSCNHWITEEINNSVPFVDNFINKDQSKSITNLFEKQVDLYYPVNLWCESGTKDTNINEFIMNKNDNKYKDCYMITLKAYDIIAANKESNKFFDEFKKNIPLPKIIKDIKINETNFWLNNGNIDTGLHYDDHDGVLCVISGKKVVTLFPPSDSKYLYSF